MDRKPLKGLLTLVPLVLKKNQEIDYEGIKENISFLEESGIDGFIALSTMGQHYGIGEKEFNKITDVCIDAAEKSICVIGTTWYNTYECIRRTKYAEDAGADAALVGIPYQLMLVPKGVVEHYRMVNNALKGDMPIMVYNDPYMSRQSMGVAIWQDHLLKMDNIKALYDENYQLRHTQSLLQAIGNKITVFEHETAFLFDALTFPELSFSTATVYGLAAPKAILEYYNACKEGLFTRANKFHDLITEGYRITPHWSPYFHANIVTPPSVDVEFLMYPAGFLNAIAEIGENKAGPPRKPFLLLPAKYRNRLSQLIQRLKDGI